MFQCFLQREFAMPAEEMNKNPTCPTCNEEVKAHWKRCPACDVPLSGTRTPTPAPVDATIGDGKTIVTPGGGAGAASASLLDRYELLDEIGRGGMGVVYKARQTDLDRIVAVKRILPESGSASMTSRFRSERNTIAKLNHQNILTVYDAGEDEEGPWLAMEYVEGGRTLKNRVKEGALPEEEVLAIGLCLCRALSCAHREGIIHRDVKPTNVLIDRDGTPKLADFGLAREGRGSDLSVTGYGMGTMAYAAPEQLRDAKGVDHRVDIYGLGALLYHLATGESPRKIRESAIPARFRAVLLKALSDRPGDRYFSVDEMAQALQKATREAPIGPETNGGFLEDSGASLEQTISDPNSGLTETCAKTHNQVQTQKDGKRDIECILDGPALFDRVILLIAYAVVSCPFAIVWVLLTRTGPIWAGFVVAFLPVILAAYGKIVVALEKRLTDVLQDLRDQPDFQYELELLKTSCVVANIVAIVVVYFMYGYWAPRYTETVCFAGLILVFSAIAGLFPIILSTAIAVLYQRPILTVFSLRFSLMYVIGGALYRLVFRRIASQVYWILRRRLKK